MKNVGSDIIDFGDFEKFLQKSQLKIIHFQREKNEFLNSHAFKDFVLIRTIQLNLYRVT